jgi:hypothetical protein
LGWLGQAEIDVDTAPQLAGQAPLVRGGQVGQAIALGGVDLRADDRLLA